jgi:hypothetical protein
MLEKKEATANAVASKLVCGSTTYQLFENSPSTRGKNSIPLQLHIALS